MRHLFLFLLAAIAASAQIRTVALTFDDLPAVDASGPREAVWINHQILDALAKHHAPAIAFVNEKNIPSLDGGNILRDWVRHGQELGNHTYAHLDLDKLSVDEFKDQVIRGEKTIAALAGKPKYLRFPFNHTGETKEKHEAVAAFLSQRGYQTATCTIDNMDYAFAKSYNAMLANKDEAAAAKLRAAYLAYTAGEIDYYTRLHVRVFGREIPHVMLFHANRLNAELLDQLLAIFEDKGYRFVTLDAAQSDAAYKTPDTYVTKFGPMWGYRWAAGLGVKVDGRSEPEPASWILNYGQK